MICLVPPESAEKRREGDSWFEPVERVYWELEKEHGIKFEKLDYGTLAGKQLREELQLRLKELPGPMPIPSLPASI